MTTRVTIKNEETSGHNIEVAFANQKFVVAPGDSITSYIWQECSMTVTELPIAVPSQPDASQAKVYTPEGVELPMKRGLGARLPDEWIGKTAEEIKALRNKS